MLFPFTLGTLIIDVGLIDKIMNEIKPRTMFEWYNLAQYNLKTMQDKLENYNEGVWGQISQMSLSDDFIRDFKKNWIGSGYKLTNRQTKILLESFKALYISRSYLNLRTYLKRLSEIFKTK
jgi:hypothetical protein